MFARKGIEVAVASRHPPEALVPQAKAIGPTVVPKTLKDALEAENGCRSGREARLCASQARQDRGRRSACAGAHGTWGPLVFQDLFKKG